MNQGWDWPHLDKHPMGSGILEVLFKGLFHLEKEQQVGPLWQRVAPAKDQVGHLKLSVAELLAGLETMRLLTLIVNNQNEKVSPA